MIGAFTKTLIILVGTLFLGLSALFAFSGHWRGAGQSAIFGLSFYAVWAMFVLWPKFLEKYPLPPPPEYDSPWGPITQLNMYTKAYSGFPRYVAAFVLGLWYLLAGSILLSAIMSVIRN